MKWRITMRAQSAPAIGTIVGVGLLTMAYAPVAFAQTTNQDKKDSRYDTNVTIQKVEGEAPAVPLSDPGNMIPTSEVPDVHIVVVPQGQTWFVSAVYSKKTPREKAEERTKILLKNTGWPATKMTFDEGQVTSMLSNDPSGLSAVMSSSTFTTTAPMLDPKDGAVALEPILLAYKDLQRVYITFMAPQGVSPHGPKEFRDDNILLFSRPEPGTLTYVTKIRNHNVTAFGLPRLEASPVAVKSDAALTTSGGNWVWMGVLGAFALVAGGSVYALMARRRV